MGAQQLYDERRVVELLSEGSEYAFTQLFDRYRARIYSTAMRFLKSPELAEEIVQEVFLKLWTRREELPTVLNLEAYIFTMTRNQIFDDIKEIAKEATAKTEFAHDRSFIGGTDHPVIEKEYQQLLDQVVEKLPPQQKQIFRLAKIEGLSHKDIAEQLHISHLTVKTHMAKALQTIRKNLQHHLAIVSVSTAAFLPLLLRIFDK